MNPEIKYYLESRESIPLVFCGICFIIITSLVSDETLISLGVRSIWFLVSALLIAVGNLKREM